MKKFLPILGLIAAVIIVVTFVFGGIGKPNATLTPREDNHWLTLKIEDIPEEVTEVQYTLTYKLPDGRQQGVPGKVMLDEGQTSIEREILIGTESSGVYYYDEGVETGKLEVVYLEGDDRTGNYESEWEMSELQDDPSVF